MFCAARLWLLGLTVTALMSVSARPVTAQRGDLRRSYRTISTEHYEIHYHVPLGVAARRAATLLEGLHDELTARMGYAPPKTVHVLLTDGTEAANGSATALPVDTVRLFVTAPDDLSVLGDYDDWLATLLIHEHTHVLHLDHIGGLPAVVNAVLGKVWAPNHALPRFVTEGIATYMESARSSGGRLRSTQFEMYMRMATLEGQLWRLDQLTHGIDAWPFGTAFYLYGSRFIAWLVASHGEGVIRELSRFYGRRAVPYGVSRAFVRATGRTITQLYDDFLEAMRREHAATAEAVRAHPAGRVEGERLTTEGMTVQYPRFVDDDTVLYRVSDGRSDNQLRRLDLGDGSARTVSRVAGAPSPSVTADGTIYADMLGSARNLYLFYDLFRRAPGARRWERLTHGRRTRAPDVSPDGRRVVFTVNGAGTTHLAIADTEDVEGTMRLLVQNRRFDQVFTPRLSPDGTKVAYSVWERGGRRDVRIIDVTSGEVTEVTRDRAMDTGPAFSPDGHYLYFSSDRSGIANLYRFRLADGALEQLTNVLAGAYMPAPSPDGRRLVYVGYTSRGFDLYALDLEAITPWTADAAPDDRPAMRLPEGWAPLRSERYRPIRTLHPRSVAFDLREDGYGPNLGVTIGGSDIAGFYAWSARLGHSLVNGQLSVETQATIARLPAPITASFFRHAMPRQDLFIEDAWRHWDAQTIGGSATVHYDMPHGLHQQRLELSYALTWLGRRGPFGGQLDPDDPPPRLPPLGFHAMATASYRFSDVRRHAFDISPSEGRSLVGSVSGTHPALGDEQGRALALQWSFTRYFENPFLEHHVLALHYAGGLSVGDAARRRAFALGGFPGISAADLFLRGTVLGGRALRGYAAGADQGARYQLAQLEYRLPIVRPQIGPGTLPLFLRRIYGAVFVDVGDAYDGWLSPEALRVGVGAELFVDFSLFYFVDWTLRTGFAYGLMDGGPHVYLHLGTPF